MSIYEDCMKRISNGTKTLVTSSISQLCLSPAEKEKFSKYTIPGFVRGDKKDNDLEILCKDIYYISDIHLFHHIMMKYPTGATDIQIKNYIKELVENMFTVEFRKNGRFLFIGGDVSSSFQLSTIFYTELHGQLNKLGEKIDEWGGKRDFRVYAVLGNHELWDFDTLEECQKAYKTMLESLDITLLCNDVMLFQFMRPRRYIAGNNEKKEYTAEYIDPQKEPSAYSKALIGKGNMIIIGGIGFAEFNEKYNAEAGLYRNTITLQREIEESEKWRNCYQIGLEKTREIRGQLIVLTHFPMQDWMGQMFTGNENCIYFSGHNHNNFLYHNDDRNIHIFANNQIGYKHKKIKLRKASLYSKGNPFASYSDGVHEINSFDYLEFYSYVNERVCGNGIVERMIEKNECNFYMIKKSGYYGFFLISDNSSYICEGGRVKKLSSNNEIGYYYDNFDAMVDIYIEGLSPYRRDQEKIARAVREIGGDGTIHGCIIDIDFTNHIMFNPFDGSMSYYYSPEFGKVQVYSSIDKLLKLHAPLLLNKYIKASNKLFPVCQKEKSITSEKLEDVDRKGGAYGLSEKVQQIQRLFSCKVLRDWNDAVLEKKCNYSKKIED